MQRRAVPRAFRPVRPHPRRFKAGATMITAENRSAGPESGEGGDGLLRPTTLDGVPTEGVNGLDSGRRDRGSGPRKALLTSLNTRCTKTSADNSRADFALAAWQPEQVCQPGFVTGPVAGTS